MVLDGSETQQPRQRAHSNWFMQANDRDVREKWVAEGAHHALSRHSIVVCLHGHKPDLAQTAAAGAAQDLALGPGIFELH